MVLSKFIQEADVTLLIGKKLLALLNDFLLLDRDVADGIVLVIKVLLVPPSIIKLVVMTLVNLTFSADVLHLIVAHF